MIEIESLVGIVVLYKCRLEEAISIRSLNTSLEYAGRRLQLFVYDNSPEKQYTIDKNHFRNIDIIYTHDPENPGLSKAYNMGLQFATDQDASWILLLDQDSHIGEDFIESYLKVVSLNPRTEIVCIIPRIISANDLKMISPAKTFAGGLMRPIRSIEPGILKNRFITGLNSGTIISFNFISTIGGFNTDFPLDMLDHWYFREIRLNRKKIILSEAIIKHNLSVNSFYEDVSIERYKNILLAERKLFRGRRIDILAYKFRLLVRLYKQLSARQTEYAKLTKKALFN